MPQEIGMMQPKLDKRFVIHIGLSKTGTTTLQELVFAKHPQVFYLGKFLHKRVLQQCRDQLSYDVLNPIFWSHDKSIETAQFEKALSALVQQEDANRSTWLASWEELGNCSTAIHLESLHRAKRIFSECRLIICLRNPLHRIPSEYLQSLRYHYFNFCRYPLNLRNLLQPSYLDFDEWLTQRLKDGYLSVLLGTSDLIQESCEIIGKDNVGVFLFEDFCTDATRFMQSMSDFIGIEHLDVLLKSDSEQERLNTRLTEGQVRFLQDLNQHPWKKLALILKKRRYRRRQLIGRGKDNKPAKASLSTEWKNMISEQTRVGNRWIVDNFALPLQEYGYPL